MKKQITKISSLLLLAVILIGMIGCKKDETVTFTLTSLKAGAIDMNLAAPATTVPIEPTITAGFSVNVDAATVTATTVTLIGQYGTVPVALTLTATGSTITIVPNTILGTGQVYTLTFAGVMSTDAQSIGAVVRTFTTEGSFAPTGMVAYWNFENNANDQVGAFSPASAGVIDVSYAASFKSMAGQAASFNGTTTLIEIPNGDLLENTSDFTLAFWVMADSTKKSHFVMGLAGWYGFQFEIGMNGNGGLGECKLAAQYRFADNTSGSEDLWFNGNGATGSNGGWQGWTFCKDLSASGGVNSIIANKWAFVTCVYDAASKVGTLYLNGEKMKAQDFNLWPAGDAKTTVTGLKYNGKPANNSLVFGFIQDKTDPTITDTWADYNDPANNHFKGMLDEVRIYHSALSAAEITMMYDSAKP